MIAFVRKILIVSLVFVLASCSPQLKLAREFVSNSNSYRVLVFEPREIIKHNLNTNIVDSLGITDEQERNSSLWESASFINKINDSLLIANYKLGFETEMKNYRVRVYDQSNLDEFMTADSNAWIVNVAQMEIEEQKYDYRDDAEFDGYVYFHDFKLNAVDINTWYEIHEINASTQDKKVYYATNTITDDLDSDFSYDVFSDKVKYNYDIDSLNTSKIYEYVYLLGRIYATYTYDLMLNRYVAEKLGQEIPKEQLLRYYPPNKSFFRAEENRFISLDE